jgi:hypothetical protein
MHNIAGVLTAAGKDVIDLSLRGWRPTKANIDKLASSLAALKLTESDTVFFDFCSNSAYMGTDRNGLPAAAEKMLDGKHHLQGDLQTAPRQVFCRILKDCSPVLEASAAAAVVLMAPTPRYVKSGCCDNPDHVSNIDSPNNLFEEELHLAVSHFRTAVVSLPAGQISRVFDIYRHFGQDEYAARDLDTGDGGSIWRDDDPVHLTDAAYMEIGMALLRGKEEDDDVFKPPKKQQRLESVVPVVPAKPEQAAKAPPPTADWLTGRLAAPKHGGQRGGWLRGGGPGGGSCRSFVRGGYRRGCCF